MKYSQNLLIPNMNDYFLGWRTDEINNVLKMSHASNWFVMKCTSLKTNDQGTQ